MSNTIILKKSGVLGKAPITSNLQLGEIAINYKDGYLFYRDNETSPAVHKINAGDADTVDGFHLNQNVLTTSTPTFDKVRLTNGSDASLSSTDHAFQVGASSGLNLIIDNNEILSRSNGSAAVLYFQNDGGDVRIGSNGGTARFYVQDGSAAAPAITFNNDANTGIYRIAADELGITSGGTLRARFNSTGIVSSANVYTASGSDFRNYGGIWKASTGLTGNGFRFSNTVDGTALTISSTGDTVASGSVTATSLVKSGGSSSEFLKADGSIDSNTYLTTSSASSTYLPLAGGTMAGNINLNDDVKIRFGDAQDLELYHSSAGDGYIVNKTGVLDIRNEVHGGDIKLQAENTSGTLQEYFRVDGGLGYNVSSQHLRIADGKALYAGDGNDLGIYHYDSNSYIENITGDLYVNTNAFRVHSADGSDEMIKAVEGASGGAFLYHNNILRLSTTSTGVSIAGTTTIDNVLILERSAGAYGAGLRFSEAGTKTWELKQDQDGGNNNSLILANSGNAPTVTFEQDGNVGIGTTSPASKLEVAEETANTTAKITVDSASWDASLSLKNANGTWEIYNDYTGLGTTGALAFWNGSYRMVIDNTGKVGIGTTSPDSQLHLYGASGATGEIRLESSNGKTFTIGSTGTSYGSANNLIIYDIDASSERLRIDTNGNVGIGNTSPDVKLHVGTGSGATGDSGYQIVADSSGIAGVQILAATTQSSRVVFGDSGANSIGMIKYDHTNDSLSFRTNGTDGRLIIDSSGRVGIGVTPSSAELEVNGHFAATTKSFIVDNPKTGGKLQYGVVESDQHSVFVRGKNDTNTIELPEEWEWLVDEDSVTVQLTSIGQMQQLFVISQDNKTIKIGGLATNGKYNYTVYGERKDVEKLEVNI